LVFTTQSGLAYSVGARARASSSASPTNFVEGLVTAYSGTSMTLTVDNYGGSGTIASWNINLAGEPAGVSQTLAGNTVGFNNSASATEYTSLIATGFDQNTTTTNGQATVGRSGTLSAIAVTLSGTPGAGKSYAFTVMVTPAGGAQAASANTCTISDATTTCTSSSSITVNAGDKINLRIVPTGTPSARAVNSLAATFGVAGGNPIQ
jgi:hypothetical protein